jgi:SAM-dependent methyltransferase
MSVPSRSDESNLFDCNKADLWIPYFLNAEVHMDEQWSSRIWPEISDFDFTCGLELSPGGGRNTKKLLGHAGELHLVDFNQYAITLCRFRFMDYEGPCRLNFHVNDGKSLFMIPDDSVTFCYCWDSAVHFDRNIVCAYIAEFSRVLRPGGKVFLHHSNLGDKADPDIRKNPHWRSNMDADRAKTAAEAAGLKVLKQIIGDWGDDKGIDCISILESR